jgi:hypothetical protein
MLLADRGRKPLYLCRSLPSGKPEKEDMLVAAFPPESKRC